MESHSDRNDNTILRRPGGRGDHDVVINKILKQFRAKIEAAMSSGGQNIDISACVLVTSGGVRSAEVVLRDAEKIK